MLVFDGIADPGNLGSLLRTARAAGCRVLLTVGCADPYAPKVVRAGAGAHFWLDRLERLEEAVITTQIRHFPQRLLATAGGARRHTDVDWSIHTALMIGGEAQGVSEAIRGLATDTVRITMPGGGESLNVGAATAVLCFAAIARGSGPEVMKRDEEDQRA
jgi:TrmH family RNA methyltransferase